jgi:hypothetical protein
LWCGVGDSWLAVFCGVSFSRRWRRVVVGVRADDLVESLTIGGLTGDAPGTESIRLAPACDAEPKRSTQSDRVRHTLRGLWLRATRWSERLKRRLVGLGGGLRGTANAENARNASNHAARVSWGAFQPSADTPPSLVAPATAFVREASAVGEVVAATLQLAMGVREAELSNVTNRHTAGVRLAHYAAHASPALPGQMRCT